MTTMTNLQLRNSIIAIVLGAVVAILQKILEAYIPVPAPIPAELLAPVATSGYYLKAMAKYLV